jgi:Bacterial Ig-like domain (group 3)
MPSHRLPRPTRFGEFYLSARKIIFVCLFAAVTALFFSSPAHAQGGVPLVTVATDQTPLNLSNQFGVPTGTVVNQTGDFAFVGNGNSALFFRAAGATSVTRLLQVGDEVPGFPGSQVLSFSSTLTLNSAKVLFFAVNFSLADGLVHNALLTYDGAAYHTIVSSDDIAPGSGGVAYGTGLQPVGISDKGDVAFSSKNSLEVPRSPITLYIALSGASPVRVVGTADQLPCPLGAQNCFPGGRPFQFLSIFPGLNTRGEVLFESGVSLYVGSTAGVVPVTMASSGPCSSSTSSFVPEGRLNNSGMIAFTNATGTVAALCIAQPAGGAPTVAIVNDGDPAPPPIVNGTLTLPSPVTINDAGDVLFESGISGRANHGLFRYRQSAGTAAVVDVVAYSGEAAPGVTNGDKFASFFFLSSMANDGHVSFETFLTTGRNAIYQQSGTGIPTLVALDGQAAPSTVGGTFGLSGFTPVGALDPVAPLGPVVALDNNSTFFASAIAGGTAAGGGAYFADFLYTPAGVQVLMSTGDSLPSASRISLATARPKAAGHFVAFAAQEAGGRAGLFVSDTSSGGIPAKVISEGDVAPTTGGVVTSVLADEFFVNAKGQVALEAPLTGGASAEGIFIWTQTAGLTKVVADRDASPIAGTTFLSVSLGGLSFSGVSGLGQTSSGIVSVSIFFSATNPTVSSLLNDSGQLAFSSVLVSGSTTSNGIFLYDPSGTVTKIAATGDAPPNGQTFVYVSSAHGLNSAGMVAFDGDTTTSTSPLPGPVPTIPGMFVGSASLAPQQIGFSGSNLLSTSLDTFLGLSDAGDVGFEEFSIAGPGQTGFGVFTGTGGGTPHVIAVEGMAAPGGGTFSLGTTFTNGNSTTTVFGNIAEMDSKSDIALRAGIAGGNTDSGYFRLLQTTTGTPQLQPVVLQGQAVPGGGTFDTIPIPNTRGADFSLGTDGALAFLTPFTSGSSKHGLFVGRADGSLVRVLATGDIAPGGGLVDLLAMGQGLAAGDPGKFAFWAGIQGGSARQAIFTTAIPPGTASTTTSLSSALAASVFGQPITLTATVNSSGTTAPGTPSGNVSFFNNGVLLGTSAVNAGQAALNVSSLPAGADSIVAQYSGDSNFAPSNSLPFAETINPRTTSTALASSQATIIGGQSATFTATVTTTAGTAPTGTVTFLDGNSTIGTGTLNSGAVATLITPALSVGSRSITARYEGDGNSLTSTSPALTEDVNIAGFGPPPTNLAVTAGQNLMIPLTLYAAPGSNLQFTLSCSGAPANSSCALGSNLVTPASPPNGTIVQLTFSTKAASSGSIFGAPWSQSKPPGLLGLGILLSSFLAAALALFQLAPRRRIAFSMCMAVFALAAVMAGCGSVSSGSGPTPNPASPGTPTGPAAITVTATAGTTTVSTVVHVTVQ